MALDKSAITAAVAAITVPQYGNASVNINIGDVDEMDPHVEERDTPVMFPAPGEWDSGGGGAPDTETTFGTPATRMWVFHDRLIWVFIQDVAGAGRDLNDYYLPASKNADALRTAFTALNISGTDVESINKTPVGVMQDPTGSDVIGCKFEIVFRERVNP